MSTESYTIHFQKHPFPGARYGMQQLAKRFSGRTDVLIILQGDATGFEAEVQALIGAGINVKDESSSAARQAFELLSAKSSVHANATLANVNQRVLIKVSE